MSASHTWIACLIFSCFIHWQVLGLHWMPFMAQADGFETAVLESNDHSPDHSRGHEKSFALHQMLEQVTDSSGDVGVDRKKQALARYFRNIKKEINLNKFSGLGDTLQMIGNTRYSFIIDAKGNFFSVSLVKSSGNPLLDKAARAAIDIAGQKVKRPDSTGTTPIPLSVTVKYQYGL